jgi:hypothetical protein
VASYPLGNVSPVDIRADVRYAIEDNNQRKLQGYKMAWEMEQEIERRKDVNYQRYMAWTALADARKKVSDALALDKTQAEAAAKMGEALGIKVAPGASKDLAEGLVLKGLQIQNDKALEYTKASLKANEPKEPIDRAKYVKMLLDVDELSKLGGSFVSQENLTDPGVIKNAGTPVQQQEKLAGMISRWNDWVGLPKQRDAARSMILAAAAGAGFTGIEPALKTPPWMQRDPIVVIPWDAEAVGKKRDKLVQKKIADHRASVAVDKAACDSQLPLVQSVLNKPAANRDSSDLVILNDYLDRKAHVDNSDRWEQAFQDANQPDISMPPQPKGAGAAFEVTIGAGLPEVTTTTEKVSAAGAAPTSGQGTEATPDLPYGEIPADIAKAGKTQADYDEARAAGYSDAKIRGILGIEAK